MMITLFPFRIKVLKRNAQAATSLTPQKQNPSNVLADTVGMTIAALAMVCLGLLTFDSLYSFDMLENS